MDETASNGTSLVEPLLRPLEVARLLGISRTKTFELLGTRAIASIKIGKRRLVEPAALEAYIATLREREAGP